MAGRMLPHRPCMPAQCHLLTPSPSYRRHVWPPGRPVSIAKRLVRATRVAAVPPGYRLPLGIRNPVHSATRQDPIRSGTGALRWPRDQGRFGAVGGNIARLNHGWRLCLAIAHVIHVLIGGPQLVRKTTFATSRILYRKLLRRGACGPRAVTGPRRARRTRRRGRAAGDAHGRPLRCLVHPHRHTSPGQTASEPRRPDGRLPRISSSPRLRCSPPTPGAG
jgi:hypothetical protein